MGVRFGKDAVKILAKEINGQRRNKEIKVAIAHADSLEVAQNLKEELEKEKRIKVLFISQVSPVVGVYIGPGSLFCAFHPV